MKESTMQDAPARGCPTLRPVGAKGKYCKNEYHRYCKNLNKTDNIQAETMVVTTQAARQAHLSKQGLLWESTMNHATRGAAFDVSDKITLLSARAHEGGYI